MDELEYEVGKLIEELCLAGLEYSKENYKSIYSKLKQYKGDYEKKLEICNIIGSLERLKSPPPNLDKLLTMDLIILREYSDRLNKIINEIGKKYSSLVVFEPGIGSTLRQMLKCLREEELELLFGEKKK